MYLMGPLRHQSKECGSWPLTGWPLLFYCLYFEYYNTVVFTDRQREGDRMTDKQKGRQRDRQNDAKGHSTSMFALKGVGVPRKAYDNLQRGGRFFKECAYVCVIFTK